MRINKFLFKFKILILLFSFVFNIFTPTFLICSDRLRSGGQLSFAVLPGDKNKSIKKSVKKKSLLADNITSNVNSSVNSSANIDINVNKDEKKEVTPEITQVKQGEASGAKLEGQEKVASEEKVEIKSEEKKEVAPEIKQVQQVLTPEVKLEAKPELVRVRQAAAEEVKPEDKKDVVQDVKLGEKKEQASEVKSVAAQDGQQVITPEVKSVISQDGQQQEKGKPEEKKEKVSEQKKQIEKDDEETVIFNFEDVDLANVAAYVETLFNVKFIPDEVIEPINPGGGSQSSPAGKRLGGNKVSFKTQKPLTKKQAWGLFVTFLNMADFALVEQGGLGVDPKFYRVKLKAEALKSAIPVFINQDPDKLPESGLVRYGYFVKDCPIQTIETVLMQLKGFSANLLMLYDHNAFIITDDAYNIKVLMKIVKELDNVTMPQTMSVLRLYKGEAEYAKQIYTELVSEGENSAIATRLFGPKTTSKTLYFPKKAKVIVDKRTNSLILLGTVEAIKTIEDFVKKYIDIDIDTPYSPLYIYDLKYANAVDVAGWMNNLVKFGAGDDKSSKIGAYRSGDKYFKNMNFTAEVENNRIIIRGDYDDYLKVKEIIDQIDEAPKQVAIEILILSVEIQDQKELGAQIRNQFRAPDGSPINFQTSGITLGSVAKTIVPNNLVDTKGVPLFNGSYRLLGDLISLVTGNLATSAGTTAISLGSDKFGVWGIFGVLDKITNTQIVANPFLTVTNNCTANVTVGETKRIITATVQGGGLPVNALADYSANIAVTVTPKINSDGMIVTTLTIGFDTFDATGDYSKTTRIIKTEVVLSNNETMALGGLIKDKAEDGLTQVPILGKIPIIGWFFKNKKKVKTKDDLLFLIHTHIIDPNEEIKENTKRHLTEYRDTLEEFEAVRTSKDPIDRSFFKDKNSDFKLDNYIFERGQQNAPIAKTNGVKPENYKESAKNKRRNKRKNKTEVREKKTNTSKEDRKKSRENRKKEIREKKTNTSREDRKRARENKKEEVRNRKIKATNKNNIELGKRIEAKQDGSDKPVAGA